jgi:gonadotropin-releasing hormone receptor
MNYSCNQSKFFDRPPDHCIDKTMKLTQTSIITVTVYSFLFILSSIFNLVIIFKFYKYKLKEKSRIHLFMFHLIIADMMITFITIPLEIGWKLSVYWRAGDFGCRLFQFLRPMGIYLESFIIISLCIDRYFAIIYPLKIRFANLRTNMLIYSSWGLSIICALPQVNILIKKVTFFLLVRI